MRLDRSSNLSLFTIKIKNKGNLNYFDESLRFQNF